ncbi:synemin [Bombina bombina]|uniref:synemin n=1 Tax=Bombina bombina TaxID=8345 RepID=UPI00235A92BD|nr:synemin [Bombina bombina]
MLQVRGFGNEKSQLRELNVRLDQYLSRVRQLEKENQLLVEEIHKLRFECGVELSQGYQEEMHQLRGQVEELSVQKGEAEIQRDNLWQELLNLKELYEQVRAMRLRIEQQLDAYKKDLQMARNSLAALEELHTRLQQECMGLHLSHQEELKVLREQALQMPLHVAIQGAVRPSLSLQEVQSFSLELSSFWEETYLIYQKKIREMEEILRLDEESRYEADEEVKAQRMQIAALHREYEELQAIRNKLEEELLRMKEKYRLKVEEYLIIIEELESEKETITLTITERLKDCQELMQVKTGLNLEVSAYRALLDSESKQGTVIWTDWSSRNRPLGSVSSSTFEQSASISGVRKGEERKIPITRITEEKRRNAGTSNIHQIYTQPLPQTFIRSNTTDVGRTNSSHIYCAKENITHERNPTIFGKYDLHKSRGMPQSIYLTQPTTVTRPYATKLPTTRTQNIKHEQVSESTIFKTIPSAEVSRGQIQIVDETQTRLNASKGLDNNLVEESKVNKRFIEVEKHVFENRTRDAETTKRIEDTAGLLKTEIQGDAIEEPNLQEIPIKKERKKREQAKKQREEVDKEEASEINVVTREKLELFESALKETHTGVREDTPNDAVGLTIPIILDISKKNEGSKKGPKESTGKTESDIINEETYLNEEAMLLRNVEYQESNKDSERSENIFADNLDLEEVAMSTEHMAQRDMVADILKHFGQPSALDDANVTYVERKQQGADGSVKTEILVQSRSVGEVNFCDEADLVDMWSKSSESNQDSTTAAEENLLEELHSRNVTKTVLGDVKGAESEEWIGNVIQAGLKGRPGLKVNIEIIEESIGSFGFERPEFSTPFQVEEADDYYAGAKLGESNEEEPHVSVNADNLQSKKQSSEKTGHVVEVTEGEDTGDETNYFVSVPDDYHFNEDDEEETLKGQIHIEDESHVKYSWQDEFLQGSQNRQSLSEFLKSASSNKEVTANNSTTEGSSTHKVEGLQPKDVESHVETVVVEKEIKVPYGFQSSIVDILSKDIKDPQQQLKGTLECLKDSLPQDLIEELSTIAQKEPCQASNFAMDIKKVDQTVDSGMVTIVAEINVSQTLDTENVDALKLGKGITQDDSALLHSTVETTETITTLPDDTQNPKLESNYESYDSTNFGGKNAAENYSSEQITKKGSETTNIHISPKRELSETSSDVSRFIKHIQLESFENIALKESTSENKEHSFADELCQNDANRSFHHIKLGPREIYSTEQIIFEGPISECPVSETIKLDISTDQNRSIRHIKISPTERYPTEQIIFEGPIFKTVGGGAEGNLSQYKDDIKLGSQDSQLCFKGLQAYEEENWSQSSSQTEDVTHGTKTVTHIKLKPGETQLTKEFIIQGSIPNVHEISKENAPDTNISEENTRPIEHKIGSQVIHIAKQTKYQGFVSEPFQMGEEGNLNKPEEQPNSNTSVHHIKVSPNREQIIFEGPISTNLHIGDQKENSYIEETSDSNRSIRHIRVGTKEIYSSEHIFEEPVSDAYDSSDILVSSPSGYSTESERSIKHIRLGPTEKSFTFQMDITKFATKYQSDAGTQESVMVSKSTNFEGHPKKIKSHSVSADEMEVAESGYGEEDVAAGSQYPYKTEIQSYGQQIIDTSEFDKTVQLQRLDDQRSVVSDEKKTAIVYLDEDEEPDQDYLRRSF